MFKKLVIILLKGILYKEDDIKIWESLIDKQDEVSDYFSKINLELTIDNDFAYLQDLNEEYKLTRKTKLSFFASFLIILLREELLKEKEIITRNEIYQKFEIYINKKDEKKLRSAIDTAINNLIKLTFLKEVEKDVFKIRTSIESFCNVKYLDDFNKKLNEYIKKLESEY